MIQRHFRICVNGKYSCANSDASDSVVVGGGGFVYETTATATAEKLLREQSKTCDLCQFGDKSKVGRGRQTDLDKQCHREQQHDGEEKTVLVTIAIAHRCTM